MQVLRIKLTQQQAHYGRPECVDNRMTYPLPPFSTVIGALHAACGYRQYHPMDIGIQGRYRSMQRELYTSNMLNNRKEDDRGHLIYLQNPVLLSAGYEPVAKALKNQGNSFRNNETIQILNPQRMEEYWELLRKKDELDEYQASILKVAKEKYKNEEKAAKEKLKALDKKSEAYQKLSEEIKEKKRRLQQEEEDFKQRKSTEYEEPMRHYKTLTKAPKYAEVLYGVDLTLHIRSDEDTIRDVEESIDNLRCIGRSEDFVDVRELKRVILSVPSREYHSQGSGYIKKELLRKEQVILSQSRSEVKGISVSGTTFYLPKNYELLEGRRVFDTYHSVCYLSSYTVDRESEQMLVDEDGYIVDLI